MALENKVIPEVLVSERAATVFKEACQAEGKNLEQSFLRIGAKPGGCSGWKYELEWNGPEDIHSEDLTIKSGEISVVVERECLTDILGPVKIDFTNKNLGWQASHLIDFAQHYISETTKIVGFDFCAGE